MLGRILLTLACLFMLLVSQSVNAAQIPARCFAETGFCIAGPTLAFWEQNGGITIFGFPTSQPRNETVDGKAIQIQQFERQRFESHPENRRPYDIELGRLGAELLIRQNRDRGTTASDQPAPGCLYFNATERAVCPPFLDYWRTHGLELDSQPGSSYDESLALFGAPLTDLTMETNSAGASVMTQWFERARLEYLPDNPEPYKVLLGLLGNEVATLPSGDPLSRRFLTFDLPSSEFIPGDYLVVFDSTTVAESEVAGLAKSLVTGTTGKVGYLFTKSLRGFVARNLANAWARDISRRPDVVEVRQDFTIRGAEARGGIDAPVSWNLDRIDQRFPLAQDDDFSLKTGPTGSAPVPIYILDNGVFTDHNEFTTASGSRVENIADLTTDDPTEKFQRCSDRGSEHGTAVASVAAGSKLGVTPTLIKNIKVLHAGGVFGSCLNGSPNLTLMGLEEALKDMQDHNSTKAVVNLSLGWYKVVPDIALAIAKLQKQGALIVAAAGNEGLDASTFEPANLPGVLAVGATDRSDKRSVFSSGESSNFGSTIAIWAPGSDIQAADWTVDNSTKASTYIGGTSLAAPQVAGAAALLWQQNPGMDASQVMSALVKRATYNMLTDLGAGSNNALLYIGEDQPQLGSIHKINNVGSNGDLQAVRVSSDGRQVFVAGGDQLDGSIPYSYAAYSSGNVSAGPSWQVGDPSDPNDADCSDIEVTSGEFISDYVYFGCTAMHDGTLQAMVTAIHPDRTAAWLQPVWLGADTDLDGITAGVSNGALGVYALITHPKAAPEVGAETSVVELSGSDGAVVRSTLLTAPGYTEIYPRGADLVLFDHGRRFAPSIDLVVATSSDPPGPNKTFLWKLSPDDLTIEDWREVPPVALATDGMVATALAVQPTVYGRFNPNITIPGAVYLATQYSRAGGAGSEPWSSIVRLNDDRVTVGQAIDSVEDGFVTSLWAQDGDLYFAGLMERSATSPADYEAFLAKSEGIPSTRRWTVTFDAIFFGFGGYGVGRGYLVGKGASAFYVVEYPIY